MKTFKSYGMHHTGFFTLASWLAMGEPFSNKTGTFRGAPVGKDVSLHTGRLPVENKESLREADYVVYSYGTPIAWHVPAKGKIRARWEMPDVTYSKTTTGKHQRPLKVAIETLGAWA